MIGFSVILSMTWFCGANGTDALQRENRTIPMRVLLSNLLMESGDVDSVCSKESFCKELVSKEPSECWRENAVVGANEGVMIGERIFLPKQPG